MGKASRAHHQGDGHGLCPLPILRLITTTHLSLAFEDTNRYVSLPLYHRDPFDRMLIAQAMTNSLAIASADPAFDVYPIQRMWA